MLRVRVWEHDVREGLESSLPVVSQIPSEDLYQPEVSIIDPHRIIEMLEDLPRKFRKNYNYKKQFIQPSTVVVKEGYIAKKLPLYHEITTRGWYWEEDRHSSDYTTYSLFLPYDSPLPYEWPDASISGSVSIHSEFVEQFVYGTMSMSDSNGYRVAYHNSVTIKADFVKLFDFAKSFLQEQFNAVKPSACDGAEVIHISNTGRVVRGWQIGHGLYNIPTLQAGWVVVKKPNFETVSIPARFNRAVTVTLQPRIYVRLNMLLLTSNSANRTLRFTDNGRYLGHRFKLFSAVYLSAGFVWGSENLDLKIPFYKHPILLLATKGESVKAWLYAVSLSHFFPLSLSSEKTITYSYDEHLSSEVSAHELGRNDNGIGRLNMQVNAQIKAVEVSSYPRDFPPAHFIEYI